MSAQLEPVVLHVIVGLGRGGAELTLLKLIKASKATGLYKHVVVTLTSTGELGEQFAQEGVIVKALGLQGLFSLPSTFILLCKEIRKIRPAIVQTWMYHSDLLGGVASRLMGIGAIIWGVRSTDIQRGGSGRQTLIVRWICARLSPVLPSVIVFAAGRSLEFHRALGYDKRKLKVISNGVNLNAVRQQIGDGGDFEPPNGTFTVGFVGRYHFVKGVDVFIEAMGALHTRLSNAIFVLVGKGMDVENSELMALIVRTGCAENFRLLGERSEVFALMAKMDVLCSTSRSEGFPNVIAEAMTTGTPCVATDVGDSAYLVGDCGAIVDVDSPVAVSDAAFNLLTKSIDERMELRRRNVSRIEKNFSSDKFVFDFHALYDSLRRVDT